MFGLGTAVGTEFILTLTCMFDFLLEEWQCSMTCILEIRFHVVQTGPELKLNNIAEDYGETPSVFAFQGLGFQKCSTISGHFFFFFAFLFIWVYYCYLFGLRQGLTMQLWVAWNSLCRQRWFQTYRNICLYQLSAGIKNVLPPCL